MTPCPFCGLSAEERSRGPACAVCGMAIPRGHWPHILPFGREPEVIHFCGLPCFENFDSLEEGTDVA